MEMYKTEISMQEQWHGLMQHLDKALATYYLMMWCAVVLSIDSLTVHTEEWRFITAFTMKMLELYAEQVIVDGAYDLMPTN